MTYFEEKNIKYYLDKLNEVSEKLEGAELFAENLCKEMPNRTCPSAYKYGCMITLTRICSLMIKDNVEEIEQIINNHSNDNEQSNN